MNFYSSSGFLDTVAEAYLSGRESSAELVRVGDKVFRLLVAEQREVIPCVRFLDYHSPLLDQDSNQAKRKLSHIDLVETHIVDRATWQEQRPISDDVAPFIDWSLFPTFESYKNHIKQQSVVKEYFRRGRKLQADFREVTFTQNDVGDDVFDFARKWKSRQLIETGNQDWLRDQCNVHFFNALRARGLLVASTLRLGGRLASVWLGFIHEGVWSGWLFTHDPEFRKYSVGHQLILAMLERSHQLGQRQFDFSTGLENYKFIYSTHVRLLNTVGHPPLSKYLLTDVRATLHRAKEIVKHGNPALFTMARLMKRKLRKSYFIFAEHYLHVEPKNKPPLLLPPKEPPHV